MTWGYRTFEAASLAETLTLVDRERPDAVLLDVKLPDGSGISILEQLKKRSPELVIIVFTGYVTHNDAFEAGLRQAYGYVTKPIDQIQVRSMLDESLKDRATGKIAKRSAARRKKTARRRTEARQAARTD